MLRSLADPKKPLQLELSEGSVMAGQRSEVKAGSTWGPECHIRNFEFYSELCKVLRKGDAI